MPTLRITVAVLLVVLRFIAQRDIEAVDATDTKRLSEPAISASHIAFIYAGDLMDSRSRHVASAADCRAEGAGGKVEW